nr:phage terminase small subunit [uncultured Anaerocolumna sp.]
MSEVRAPNYELAENDYMSGMKYKDIAEKYNVTINTVKSWKQRYNWNKKGVHTKEKECTQKKAGAPIGNKNAVGNNGGAPEQNKNAEKHGFFSKYLPEDTFSIIQEIQQKDPLDILWENIQIAYAAIIRAQNIMHVTGKDEMIKELKKSKVKTSNRSTAKTNSESSEEEYEYAFQFAWDRQATFMNAQARAQSELRSLIKQYDESLNSNWDLATEEQRQRINLIKAQTDKITGNNQEIEDLSDVDGDIYGDN